jgi:hypothetical protein
MGVPGRHPYIPVFKDLRAKGNASHRQGARDVVAEVVKGTTGASSKPLSSMNTRLAFRRRAFFDAGPLHLHPPLDRGLVALPRPTFRFLGTPAGVRSTRPIWST